MTMDIEPEIRKEERRRREQAAPVNLEEHEEVEGMTERPYKTHELESSPLKIWAATVFGLLVAGLFVGALYWVFALAKGGG